MNRLGKFSYGAAIAGIVLLTAREVIWPGIYVYQSLAPRMAALAVFGWFIATFGPLALSIWVWRMAPRLDPQWVLHLLFLPFGIAVGRAGASILFFACDVPDGDSIQGHTLLAASCILVLALLIHSTAFAALAVRSISRRSNAG